MVNGFAVQVHGSATVASVHRLFDDPNQTDRLHRILSDHLLTEWPRLNDDQLYIVDIGIACTGTQEIPTYPTKGKRDTDEDCWQRVEGFCFELCLYLRGRRARGYRFATTAR